MNNEPSDKFALRRVVSRTMESRYEKLVWIAADERVTYRSVVAIIAKLTPDTPDLHVAIVTKSQIGAVRILFGN